MTREEADHYKAQFWGRQTAMPVAARVSEVHRYIDDPHPGRDEIGLSLESPEWEVIAWSTRAADAFFSLLTDG